jgi:hypothetical protein
VASKKKTQETLKLSPDIWVISGISGQQKN